MSFLLDLRVRSFLYTFFSVALIVIVGFSTSEVFRQLLSQFKVSATTFFILTVAVPELVKSIRAAIVTQRNTDVVNMATQNNDLTGGIEVDRSQITPVF